MEELTEREQELKSIPELRRLAMSVAGNPTMKTIMSCVAGSVDYGYGKRIGREQSHNESGLSCSSNDL